jgi:tRNA threonylcarbamoyladenosine modification (KEOPS) complex  Pcc1 subunit
MPCAASERATIRRVGEQLVIHVHWHDAADLQTYLRRRGFASVPMMGAGKRETCLEMESIDEAGVRAAVADWLS